MRHVVCSVYDSGAEVFGRPIFVSAIGLAVRSFQDEVNRSAENNALFHHTKDFALYHLGAYDDVSGTFESFPLPQKVCDGLSVKSVNGSNGHGVS